MNEKLHLQLRKQYNPEGSSLRILQMNLLDVLVSFDTFAREHNIRYSLAYGTMLGAIRHKGFIPWDDDVDIMMNREEWNKLKQFLNESPYLTQQLYVRMRLKPELMIDKKGMVDVFIYDRCPNNIVKQWFKRIRISLLQWFYRCHVYYEAMKNGNKPHVRPCWIFMPIALLFSKNTWENRWKKSIDSFVETNIENKYCCYTAPVSYMKQIFSSQTFDEYTNVEFEKYKFPIVKEYDKYLNVVYGDYMKIPLTIHNHKRVNK